MSYGNFFMGVLSHRQVVNEDELDLENYRKVYKEFRNETAQQTVAGGNEATTELEKSMKWETIMRERQMVIKLLETNHKITQLEESIA